MMSLWMAPDGGAGKIWGLQPRSALVASGRQQILHLFYFFFKFVLLFYFIFCLFLAFFFFFSCHLLLFQQGPWQPMPLPVGCHLRSPLRAGDRCQELQVSVNRREAARHLTEQGLGALFPWSVQRGTRSPPCSTLTTLPEGPKMAAPPFSSLLLVATRRAEPRPPPLRFLRTTTPSMPRAAADVRLPPPALHYPAGLRGGYQSACFVLGGAREWGWLPRERAKRKRRGGSGAGDVSSRAAPPLPLPELGPREWQR